MERLDLIKVIQSVLQSVQRCKELQWNRGQVLLFMQIGRQERGAHDESAMAVSAAIEVLQRQRESALVDVTVGQAAMIRVSTD